MDKPMSVPDRKLHRRVLLLANQLHADAFVWGRGLRNFDGSVQIDEHTFGVYGVPEKFVTDYASVAHDDIVAMRFAAFSNLPQIVSVSSYEGRDGKNVAKYLGGKDYRITELLISGLDSSLGLAWVTFYRQAKEGEAAPPPFSWEEAEDAQRTVPYHLYRWQTRRAKSEDPETGEYRRRPKAPLTLVNLTATEMRVAVLLASGMLPKTIAASLGIAVKTVRTHITNIYEKLHVDTSGTLARKLSDGVAGKRLPAHKKAVKKTGRQAPPKKRPGA